MVAGFSILIAGLVLMSMAPRGLSPYAWLALAAGVTGVGMGMAVPAANNATLQLAPEQISSIAGLRGMFRQSGSIIAVSVTTAILARSADPGRAQAHAFLVFAGIILLAIPLILTIPDHRGRW
jgi:MFS family permease